MDVLRCDKPYNIDEARKKKGLPRRRRKDSRTTAYELTIRVPAEYGQYFDDKKKLTRVVYVLNKKDDLQRQKTDFENEMNAKLGSALAGLLNRESVASSLRADTLLGDYIDRYRELRSFGAIRKSTMENEENFARYVKASIGTIPIKDLTSADVEKCILEVPLLSEKWAKERKELREKNRRTGNISTGHRKLKPLGPIIVAGPDRQYKVLKFIREVLNDAIDRELLEKNVAKAKFLSKNFKKSKPLIDPLLEDDAARLLKEIKLLPVGFFKVATLLLFCTGMRPEEMLAVSPGSFQLSENSEVRIVKALEHGTTNITDYAKSDSAYRTVGIDSYTAEEVKKWIAMKTELVIELGFKPSSNMPLISEHDRPMSYEGFKKRWDQFIKKIGFEGVRPYALRHTFATLNLARGENIKTISYLMGHANPSYTLDLYIGYVPSTAVDLANRYMNVLDEFDDDHKCIL